jgi:hypothetical protein
MPNDHTKSTELVSPNIGWSNAIPDSHATVDMSLNGTSLTFRGSGYHDKNWGVAPFTLSVGSWYWGHARLGPYSIVWFDVLDPNGTEYVSGYVSKDGKVLSSSCTDNSVKARPWGKNKEYPPTVTTGHPNGYDLVFDLGKDVGTFEARVTMTLVIAEGGPTYVRYLGTAKGGLKGGKPYTGVGLWEQFKYWP